MATPQNCEQDYYDNIKKEIIKALATKCYDNPSIVKGCLSIN
jgi:hypothetical protein